LPVSVDDDTKRAIARRGPEQIGVAMTTPPTAKEISQKDVSGPSSLLLTEGSILDPSYEVWE
jgi:hypothetical protein